MRRAYIHHGATLEQALGSQQLRGTCTQPPKTKFDDDNGIAKIDPANSRLTDVKPDLNSGTSIRQLKLPPPPLPLPPRSRFRARSSLHPLHTGASKRHGRALRERAAVQAAVRAGLSKNEAAQGSILGRLNLVLHLRGKGYDTKQNNRGNDMANRSFNVKQYFVAGPTLAINQIHYM